MEKSTKILLIVLASLLGLAGVVLIMFFKKSSICGGFAFLCFGVAFIVLGIHNKFEYDENREIVDEAMDEFKKNNREESEMFDLKKEKKAIKKVYRQFNRDRTHISLFVAGVVFVFVSFFIF